MKKHSKKLAVLLVLMLAVTSMMLTSCGSKTLEDFVNDDPEVKKEIENFEEAGMEIIVKDNTLTYEYTFSKGDIPDGMEDLIKEELAKQMESQGSVFEGVAAELEKETKIDGIKVELTYKSAGGDVLYKNTYEAKAE